MTEANSGFQLSTTPCRLRQTSLHNWPGKAPRVPCLPCCWTPRPARRVQVSPSQLYPPSWETRLSRNSSSFFHSENFAAPARPLQAKLSTKHSAILELRRPMSQGAVGLTCSWLSATKLSVSTAGHATTSLKIVPALHTCSP